MNKRIFKSVILLVLLLSMTILYAQNPSPPNRTPPPPPGVPIDGGLFALLAVGVGYAVRKLKFKK